MLLLNKNRKYAIVNSKKLAIGRIKPERKRGQKVKRFLMSAVACLLIFVMITSCYPSRPANMGNVFQSDNVKITDWVGSGSAESTFENDMLDEFEKRNPNIQVKRVVHDGDRAADFESAAANGNAPDVILISYPMLQRYAEKGLLEPINKYWSAWEEADKFNPDILELCRVGENIYGIPGDCYLMGMVYNKRLFEEAGLTHPPENWSELLEYAKILTDPQRQQVGFGLLTGEWVDWWFEYFVWQAGGDLTQKGEDGSIICTFTDKAVVQAAEFYRTLKHEKVIDPDLNITNDDIQKKFAEGKIGITFGTIGDTAVYTQYGMEKEDIGYAVFPVGPAGENPSQFGGNMYSINADSPENVKDAAFSYISFLRSEEYLTKKYEDNTGNDVVSSYISVRSDINQQQLVLDEEIQDVLDEAYSNYKLEYYGKAVVGDYLIEALRNIMTDDSADIEEELKKAEEKAKISLQNTDA